MTTTERLDSAAAADYVGVAQQTLALWRSAGRYSLPYSKIGRKIYYSRADLDAWLSRRTGTSTAGIRAAVAAE